MKFKENIIVIVLSILVLAGAYFWYSKFRTPYLSQSQAGDSTNAEGGFLAVINKMGDIKLDTEFLRSEKFLQLKDLAPVIEVPENPGRNNPFAPL
ncbi:MAG: hypothetical protein Q7R75_00850 [bacterium]|nr:hypothetical protein [bacterium]